MLTHERLLEILAYDPETGVFTRKKACKGHEAGKIMGTIRPDGRRAIQVDWGRYLGSRLAWFYVTGSWPKCEIDHKNCIYGDDRFCNLRESTRSQNMANTRISRKKNSSGLKGVSWNKRDKRWIAFAGKRYLGSFESKEDAYSIYCKAMEVMYGEYARMS